TDIVDDQVDVVGRAFLGVTLACARCHDHKFDPISTEDYYGLAGIFFSSHILPGPGPKTEGSKILRIPLVSKAEVEKRKRAVAWGHRHAQSADQHQRSDGEFSDHHHAGQERGGSSIAQSRCCGGVEESDFRAGVDCWKSGRRG